MLTNIRKNQQGFVLIEIITLIFIVLILITIAVAVYREHKDSHKSASPTISKGIYTDTYTYANYLFPNLPNGYTEVGKRNFQYNPPGVEYLTTKSTSAVIKDMETVCKFHKFSLDGGPSVETDSYMNSPAYTETGIQCEDIDNTWGFAVTKGVNIKYQDSPPVLPSSLANDLKHLNELYVGSYGQLGY